MVEQLKLESITTKIGSGATPRGGSTVYVPEGVSFIRSQNVHDVHFKNDGLVYLDDAAAHTLKGVAVEENDVLINITGDSILRTTIVPKEILPARVNQHVAILRADPRQVDPHFLQYALVTPESKSRLFSLAQSGGTRSALTKGDLQEFTLTCPTITSQQGIVSVLKSIDDKIEANTKLAENVSIYNDTLFQRLASGVENRELLSDLVGTQYGFTTSATETGEYKLLRVTDINKKPWITFDSAPFCEATAQEAKRYQTQPGDLLVARMADPGKVALIEEGTPPSIFASYLVRLKVLDNSLSHYIYYFLRSCEYQNYSQAVGDGSVQRNMNAKLMVEVSLPMPDVESIRQFTEKVVKVHRYRSYVLRENTKLAELRDYLLPRLMSGKITVRAAEESVASTL